MKHRFEFLGIALLLLCLATDSGALTLGRMRGAALIGRPLEVTVQVQLEAGEDATALCFEADVFHADTRQEGSRVRVLVDPAAPAQTVNLRVQSSAPIDEPVVTVYLRTGCGQQTSRRYVLLADIPSEIAAPMVPPTPRLAAPPAPGQTRPAAVESVQGNAAKTPGAAPRAQRPAAPARRVSARPAVKASDMSSGATPAAQKSRLQKIEGQSRLKLDPLELFSDRIASQDGFMSFAATDDALRTVQKVQALEADVKALRASAAINEVSLRDLHARLQLAQAQRLSMAWVYALSALVLLCLAAVAYLLYRQRSERTSNDNWWSGLGNRRAPTDPQTQPGAHDAELTGKALREAKARHRRGSHATPVAFKSSDPSSEVDVSMVEMSHSSFDQLMESESAAHAVPKPARTPVLSEAGGHALSGDAEALLDVGQQVEFLVSLGKSERAIALLKKMIHDSAEPHPSPYLDLLGLLHARGLKIEFQQTRAEFSRLFNARVAEFAAFRDEGQLLESYPKALSRIAALWPRREARKVIEAYMLRDPRHPASELFDLAAFRELLLLHAIMGSMRSWPSAKDEGFAPTQAPSADTHAALQAHLPGPAAVSPKPLDLDLSDSVLDNPQPERVGAPEVDIALFSAEAAAPMAQPIEPAPAPGAENLLNFDLAELPKLPKPGAPRAG